MHTWRNSTRAYGIVAQVFHWLVAALVFIQISIGLYVDDLPISMARLRWMSWHKSVGITILALVLLRLAWRLVERPPPLPEHMPTFERIAARLTHWALYGLLILTPLAGWLTASAMGLSVNWFGWVLIPDLISKNPELGEVLEYVHWILVRVLAALFSIHILAALRHGLRRDGVLTRMVPFMGDRR